MMKLNVDFSELHQAAARMTNTATDEKARNLDHVRNIARDIEEGMTFAEAGMDHEEHGCEPDDQISGFDYLSDALDIEYIIASDRETVLGARVLVAFGGPNIWIDTRKQIVELFWWGDYACAECHADAMDIQGAIEELYNC